MSVNQDNNDQSASYDDNFLKRKRIRIPKSCIPCLKGKRACDRARPACGRCSRSSLGSECTYDPRLPDAPTSNSTRQSVKAEYDSDDDNDVDRRHPHDSQEVARLERELREARNEAQKLKRQLASQSQSREASSSAAPPIQRGRTYSRSQDMHAARGLQMLAEIAGPKHQDASSNADRAGVLHWSNRSVNTSSAASSTQLSPNSGSLSSSSTLGPRSLQSLSTSTDGISPSDRQWHSPSTNTSRQFAHDEPAKTGDDSNNSPKNINGTQIYYGDDNSGDQFLRRMPVDSASSNAAGAASGQSGPAHGASVRKDIQTAFNSLLDPSHDTFPFATIWSSGQDFFDEVLPFFPRQEEFDSICASFVRHFSAMCPALTIPFAINHARTFSRMTREEKGQVSLPWLAVFLMICALGKDCDLESASVGVDKKVMMLDAFLSGEASQQPSRASSPPAFDGDAPKAASKSPVMVSDLFLSAAYQSLRLCSFLSSPTLQTIHSQLLIGSYLLNTERAASFWPLLGSVARQAQSIGLHVDPYKIKADWDPVEADIRRRLWWAVVHQDVILSGIFGRPLGITRFSCKFPGSSDPNNRTFATLQCEFSQYARVYLDENQDRSWSQHQVTDFTEKVLQWYMQIPAQYRPDLGRLDLFGSETESEVVENWTAAGVDLNTKGLMEVHQSGNLAVEVFYTLLTLHRSNILTPNTEGGSQTNADTPDKVNEVSLHICAQALRRITRAQQTMNDVLGRARGTMFWKIAYYTYQAAIAGAYIVFLRPQSKHAESALSDLAILTDYFDRMPERWNGLKTAKHGLRVLRKLAIAARENPKAASMPLKTPALTTKQDGNASAPPSSHVAEAAFPAELSLAMPAVPASTSTPAPLASHLMSSLEPSTPSSGSAYATAGVQSTFLPALFNSSFLPSSNVGSPGGNLFGLSSTGSGSHLFAAAAGGNTAIPSPGGRAFSSTPLALFNNTYDLQENGGSATGAGAKAGFCYDPFVPEPTLNKERDSPHSSGSTASVTTASPALTALYGLPASSAASAPFAPAYDPAPAPLAPTADPLPAPLNHKELANYWSEYFSLQLDWDRLTSL